MRVLLVVLLLVSISYCIPYASTTCSYEGWDLISLQYPPTQTAPPLYSFSNPATGDVISINFCAQVSTSTGCTSSTSSIPPVAAPGSCQSFVPAGAGAPQVLGDATTANFTALSTPYVFGNTIFTEGVILTYSGGGYCQKFNNYRTTQILVVCPPVNYAGPTEQIVDTGEPGSCLYNVLFVSQYGCTGYRAESCSYDNFNLLPLQYNPNGNAPAQYSYFNTQTRDTISINFCAQVSANTGCNSSSIPSGSCQGANGVFQAAGDAKEAVFSPLFNAVQANGFNFTEGVILTYINGSYCSTYNVYRNTEIVVVCPPTGYSGPIEQIISANENNCFYQVVFVSQYGCPINSNSNSPYSTSCSWGNWDLTPLQYDPSGPVPPGYSFFNPITGTIIINFCAQVPTSSGCAPSPLFDAPGSCKVGNGLSQVIGEADKAVFAPLFGPIYVNGYTFTVGIILAYYDGIHCEHDANTITEIAVVCPPSGYVGLTEQIISTKKDNCFYQVVFVSQHGCPVNK